MSFSAHLVFQILEKKHTYEFQNIRHTFLLLPFSNIKKAYLQTSKHLAQLFAHLLFKY